VQRIDYLVFSRLSSRLALG